jgi:hypothetical protein
LSTYEEFSKKPRSEKVILAIIEAVQEFKLFELHSGSVYKRDVDHFVSRVKVEGVDLVQGTSTVLSAGQFYFDATAKKLYVRLTSGADPKTERLSVTFKFFFSNAPVFAANDLAEGEPVGFEARISDGGVGALGQTLDDENTGVVLESSSSLKLINNDGFFDDIFDVLVWENQTVDFYSWSPSLPISEAQRIFTGVVDSKDFGTTDITFKVKDFVFKLKNVVNLPVYSDADGILAPSVIETPKRRIYGQVKQLKCVGMDQVLGGYPLTGTISVTIDSDTLIGAGTSFLDELSPGDEVYVVINNDTVKFGIDSVQSDISATLGSKADQSFVSMPATNLPQVPWRKKNRVWSIAGHKLRAPSTFISSVISNNRVTVDDTSDLFAGDSVKVNDEFVYIRRVSGDQVVFNSALSPSPSFGDSLSKNPVSRAFFKAKELFIERDWVLTNGTEAYLTLDELAEFNQTEPKSLAANFLFTNGSRSITTNSSVDLRSVLKSRDWIRKNSVTEVGWYEILEVKEQEILIRTPFAGTTQTTTSQIKVVDLIDDDALITVNCMGMEVAGEWIKNPAQAVRHLVLNDAEFSSVNDDSFNKAMAECDFILSMVIPEAIGDDPPQIKDVITKINESVFGSLYGNSAMEICFSILNSKKPEAIETLKDDDIESYDVKSDQKIINAIKVNYRPFVDFYTGEDTFETYTDESDFVNRIIGIKNTEERTVYLYEDDKAKIIAQRILFFRSMSNCKVTVKTGLNLATKSVNDKMFLDLERLFRRYGGRDRKKVGTITSIKKTGTTTEAEITDLGNLFNRVPAIAPNTVSDYDGSTREEAALWGYVVDDETLTPNVLSEVDLGNNLIG